MYANWVFFSYVAKIITEEFRVKLVAEDREDYCYLKTLILRNVFWFDFLTLPHKDFLHPAPEFQFLKKELHRSPPPDINSFIHHTAWKLMCMNIQWILKIQNRQRNYITLKWFQNIFLYIRTLILNAPIKPRRANFDHLENIMS